ncbi:hypothetical protein KSP40_PGU013379 [Platanthera guangdongensis]|uniref:Transcription repressor n=1 Tax=Platanthera guangdongensis TaxID=2320717 RepID=A0ABR2MFZ3_9ASPA
MARRLLDSSASKDDDISSHQPHPPKQSTPSNLRIAPVVSSSFCCPRRRRIPRPKLSAAADAAADDLSRARETPAYLWRKDEKWHPVSYDGFSAATAAAISASAPSPSPPPKIISDRPRRRTSKKKPRQPKPSRMFSSDEEEEERADEEDEADLTTADNSFEMTELKTRRAEVMEGTKTETNSPWRSRLSPYLGVGEGESLAVVKQSEDPRADFRRSMAEMVVEKEIYGAEDLEKLLQCFLSLNSQHHHRAIIAAFTDVWEALYPATPFVRSPGPGSQFAAY